MVIQLDSELARALSDRARADGVTPEELALVALRKHFIADAQPVQPQDEWERQLLAAASDCGVSLSHESLGSEELYD